MNRMVFCPLLNKEIDGDEICFDVAVVAMRERKPDFAPIPREILKIDNWREICNHCENNLMDK